MSKPNPTTDGDETATIEAEPHEVLDPEDYNQNRRLKAIHKARDDVNQTLKDVTRGKAPPDEHYATRTNLAHAVAAYGHELRPLMRKANYEHEFGDKFPVDDIYQYIDVMGQIHQHKDEWDKPPVQITMAAYAIFNNFMADVGLGVDFDDKNDEWEIQT